MVNYLVICEVVEKGLVEVSDTVVIRCNATLKAGG